ncbi:hypothetical protein EBZ39_06150 [bacterium]|nr:hypothetical protein [bacterium]
MLSHLFLCSILSFAATHAAEQTGYWQLYEVDSNLSPYQPSEPRPKLEQQKNRGLALADKFINDFISPNTEEHQRSRIAFCTPNARTYADSHLERMGTNAEVTCYDLCKHLCPMTAHAKKLCGDFETVMENAEITAANEAVEGRSADLIKVTNYVYWTSEAGICKAQEIVIMVEHAAIRKIAKGLDDACAGPTKLVGTYYMLCLLRAALNQVTQISLNKIGPCHECVTCCWGSNGHWDFSYVERSFCCAPCFCACIWGNKACEASGGYKCCSALLEACLYCTGGGR